MLLKLAQSPRERECLSVKVLLSKHLGYRFQKLPGINELTIVVEHCIMKTQSIRETRYCSDPIQSSDGTVQNC